MTRKMCPKCGKRLAGKKGGVCSACQHNLDTLPSHHERPELDDPAEREKRIRKYSERADEEKPLFD